MPWSFLLQLGGDGTSRGVPPLLAFLIGVLLGAAAGPAVWHVLLVLTGHR